MVISKMVKDFIFFSFMQFQRRNDIQRQFLDKPLY